MVETAHQVIQVLVPGLLGRGFEALRRVEFEDDLGEDVEDGLAQHVGLAVQVVEQKAQGRLHSLWQPAKVIAKTFLLPLSVADNTSLWV